MMWKLMVRGHTKATVCLFFFLITLSNWCCFSLCLRWNWGVSCGERIFRLKKCQVSCWATNHRLIGSNQILPSWWSSQIILWLNKRILVESYVFNYRMNPQKILISTQTRRLCESSEEESLYQGKISNFFWSIRCHLNSFRKRFMKKIEKIK